MHRAPIGYYFLNDIEIFLPDDKKTELRQLRANKRYDDIRRLLAELD